MHKNILCDTENSNARNVLISLILKCEFCDNIYSNVADLLKHSSIHVSKKGFDCSPCNMKLKAYKELVLHLQCDCPFKRQYLTENLKLPSYFVCNVCEEKFSSYEQLYDHRFFSFHFFPRATSLSDLLQLSCEYCGNLYENAECLMKHYVEDHGKNPISRKMPASTKDRKHLCELYAKSFTTSSHLGQHLRFHKGVKPFACKEPECDHPVHCTQYSADLKDHVRKYHTRERPYHCLVCRKHFLTGAVYYQHCLIHTGERRYGCDIHMSKTFHSF